MPRPASFDPAAPGAGADPAARIVYFPSCAARTMGPARGNAMTENLPAVTDRLMRKAGYEVFYPACLAELCCGQPFESKGSMEAADLSRRSSSGHWARRSAGNWPIVFDTSPCAYRMKRYLEGRLPVLDSVEVLHDHVLARLELRGGPARSRRVHAVCSVRKQGLEGKLGRSPRRARSGSVMPAEVGCCGWAGDKGFTVPELNAHALRDLRSALPAGCADGYSTSRTCEIGLAHHSGVPYRSIVYLVDACARPRPA